MTKRKGLKPCPFCGCRAGVYEDRYGGWVVQCDVCGCGTLHGDKESVIRWWNRRYNEKEKENKKAEEETEVVS